MEILFVLRLNKQSKQKPATVYCRITVNGVRAGDFSTFVKVPPSEWNSKAQTIVSKRPEAQADNETLTNIRTSLKEIFNDLMRQQMPISAHIIKAAYLRSLTQACTFLEAFWEMIERKRVRKIAESTIKQNLCKLRNLERFLTDTKQLHLLPGQFDERMADSFDIWLRTNLKRCGNDHVMKHLQLIKQALSYCVRQKYITQNPLQFYEIKFDKLKFPVFLTELELSKLENYAFASPLLQKVADMYVFNCYTGFAFIDYVKFHPDEHLWKFGDEVFIIKDRQKSQETAMLPFLQKAQQILNKYNGNLPKMAIQTYNRLIKEVAALLNIKKNLTTHTARKTAAMMWLNNGVPEETVARMLGHTATSSIRRYARILPKRIAEDTKVLK